MYLELLIRWRTAILVAWIGLLLVFLGVVANRVFFSDEPRIDNSVGIWFDQADPELVGYQRYNRLFGEREWTLLLLETESIYDPGFLTDLDTITRRLQELDHVVKITSITNVRDNFTDADGMLDYRRLFDDSVLKDPDGLKKYRGRLERNPIFDRNLILKGDEKHTVVLIQNDNYLFEKSPYRIGLVDSIESILSEYESIDGYALAGTTVVNAELNRAAKHDVFVFYSLVTVLLTIIGLYMLKNVRDLIVMYSVVLSSTVPAMGLLAALDIPYNMVTVMLPTILIALSVAGVIHIVTEFHRMRMAHGSEEAMRLTLRQLYKPTLWTTLTTIAGFCALTISDVYPVFQLGAFAAFGLVLGCIANLLIAPILLLALWPDRSTMAAGNPQSGVLGGLQSKRGFTAAALALGFLITLPLFGLSKLEVDTNYVDFFSGSHSTSRSYEQVKAAGFAQNPIIVHLQYAPGEPYSSESALAGTLAFEDALKRRPEVIKLLSPSQLLGEINQAFNGDEARPLKEYDKPQIEQLLLMGELSGNDDLADLMTRGGGNVQLVVMTDYMSSRELGEFKKILHGLEKRYLPPEVTMSVTGTTTLWANMDSQVSRTQLLSLITISVFLAIFLPLIFGSIRLGLVGLLVNVLPLAATLGCMSLLGIKINIATALIGGISLGIVVDDTIHLISRILQSRRDGFSTD